MSEKSEAEELFAKVLSAYLKVETTLPSTGFTARELQLLKEGFIMGYTYPKESQQ